ncbi:IclR family transcriptional regulator [Euzebya tangerina]|uniref:IclR family transcriptional regulator n=1 Tax=Euzebya tangerina TaxID=591198 RepID=UPI000E323358|nr:IclR family transcriptional regulator [Euzebya tangerina]
MHHVTCWGQMMAGVAAVEKAGMVLSLFSAAVPQMSVRQIAERSGLPRSTAHGICTSLCAVDLLELVEGGGYRLGPALVGLGGQVIDRTGMVAAAEGILDTLPHRPGLEAHLGQLVGGWIVYLDRAARPPLPAMRNRVGLRAPAHVSGCGKAALSLLAPEEAVARVADVVAQEGLRPVDAAGLRADLTKAKERGFVINTGFQRGRRSVAAPISAAGRVVGGISLAGPNENFSDGDATRAADRVRTAAQAVSEVLTKQPITR